MAKMPASTRRANVAASHDVPIPHRYPAPKVSPNANLASKRSPIDPRVNKVSKNKPC